MDDSSMHKMINECPSDFATSEMSFGAGNELDIFFSFSSSKMDEGTLHRHLSSS